VRIRVWHVVANRELLASTYQRIVTVAIRRRRWNAEEAETWEGSPAEPVCPNCQLAERFPLCESLVDPDGVRVGSRLDPPRTPRKEMVEGYFTWCEHRDLTRGYMWDAADWPDEWTCPRCGGSDPARLRPYGNATVETGG
jgi:rubredoxin